ncbi:MAG: hypothetical protein ABJO36_13020 [Litorimonas sp.]
MTEIRHDKISDPSDASRGRYAEQHDVSTSASSDTKIAWLTVGTLTLGIWAAFFGFIVIVSVIGMAPFGLIDTTGVGILIGMVLIFVVLPAFGAWTFFKSSRRLSRQRRDKFVNKKAFE